MFQSPASKTQKRDLLYNIERQNRTSMKLVLHNSLSPAQPRPASRSLSLSRSRSVHRDLALSASLEGIYQASSKSLPTAFLAKDPGSAEQDTHYST